MPQGIPKTIKKEHIISALATIDREGYPKEHESTRYSLVYQGRKYPPVWVIRTASIVADGAPLDPRRYSGGEQSNTFLKKLGFRIVRKTHTEIDQTSFDFETMNRERIWREIRATYRGQNIPAHVLKETYRITGGSAGFFLDRERTAKISNDASGITVSIFPKGPRDLVPLSDTAVLLTYPETHRRGGLDAHEITATKNAKRFNIPVFVIARSGGNPTRREVKKGYVRDWDDETRIFLVEFGKSPEYTRDGSFTDEIPFSPHQKRRRSPPQGYEGNPRFAFDVFKRYGRRCAVCDMQVEGIVSAAHIIPVSEHGSDDPRNGIPLCQNHQAAFATFSFAIHPGSYQVVTRENGPTKEDLEIRADDLSKKKALPERRALQWHYRRFQRENRDNYPGWERKADPTRTRR